MSQDIALITNIPAPYRVPVFDIVASYLSKHNINFIVYYLAKIEPNRKWKLPPLKHNYVFLNSKSLSLNNRTIHFGFILLYYLQKLSPDIIISSGFSLSALQAFFWSAIRHKPYISFSDGTLQSEYHIGVLHKAIRHIIVKNSSAYICTSHKTRELYLKYGANFSNCFLSPLSIDNDLFLPSPNNSPKYDLLFVGRLTDGKMPLFIAEIMTKLNRNISLDIIGDGKDRDLFLKQLTTEHINFHYEGFVQPSMIHHYYKRARILPFPTRADAWGVVANEACAAGLPVITTPDAGVAGELIQHGKNGFILPADVDLWVDCIQYLLRNPSIYDKMSRYAQYIVQNYSFSSSAKGILEAIIHSL